MLAPPQLADAATLCQRTVNTDFAVDTTALRDAGWAYTQPRQGQNSFGSFEQVDYSKSDLTIALLDYSSFVMCRAVGLVADEASFTQLRRDTTRTLGAVRLADAHGFEEFYASVIRGAPQTDPDNLWILGDYTLEFVQDAMPANAAGAGLPAYRIVMATSFPISPQFRPSAVHEPDE